jgi:hypothetical protein
MIAKTKFGREHEPPEENWRRCTGEELAKMQQAKLHLIPLLTVSNPKCAGAYRQ